MQAYVAAALEVVAASSSFPLTLSLLGDVHASHLQLWDRYKFVSVTRFLFIFFYKSVHNYGSVSLTSISFSQSFLSPQSCRLSKKTCSVPSEWVKFQWNSLP